MKKKVTPRQREVLDCITEGLRNKEIADTMFITEKSVEAHINRLFKQLEFDNRVKLAVWWALKKREVAL